MDKPVVASFLNQSTLRCGYVPFMIMMYGNILPAAEGLENVSISIGEGSKDMSPYKPSAF
jgi:hypothetical protein